MEPHLIESLPFVERVFTFDTIDSTNTFARSLEQGPREGILVVTAARQSGGHGQRGNSFCSSLRGGMWASLLVRLDDLSHHFRINRSLALAARAALAEEAALRCGLKWPNDLFVGGRKIGGILLESSARLPGVVVAGLGINVDFKIQALPPHLHTLATTVRGETGATVDPALLLYRVVNQFYRHLGADDHSEQQLYRQALLGVGMEATIAQRRGTFVGVDASGRARLQCGEHIEHFFSGPLRFVPPLPTTPLPPSPRSSS